MTYINMNLPRSHASYSDSTKLIAAIIIILLVVAVVIATPFVFIWAINTLFGMKIAYTLLNWFAAFVLLLLIGKPGINKSKKD